MSSGSQSSMAGRAGEGGLSESLTHNYFQQAKNFYTLSKSCVAELAQTVSAANQPEKPDKVSTRHGARKTSTTTEDGKVGTTTL